MRRMRTLGGGREADHNKTILEQYKLYVEMADRISGRRMVTNSFFLAIQTAIIAGVFASGKAVLSADPLSRLGLAACGLLIALLWLMILRSYRQLNSAKYRVIHEIEKELPIAPFDEEWRVLGGGMKVPRYLALTRIEQCVPLCIASLYFVFIAHYILNINEVRAWLNSLIH